MEFERTLAMRERGRRPMHSLPNVKIKVSIPVTKGGYTGQRDQWEAGEADYVVSLAPNGNIKLEAPDKSVILFSKDDLEAALRALNTTKPVLRLDPEAQR